MNGKARPMPGRLARCALAAAILALGGCGGEEKPSGAAAPPGPRGEVGVFAAASLADVLADLIAAHRARADGRVRLSLGATSDLARQVKAGAPADLFISASRDWIDDVAAAGAIETPAALVARNTLVCIAERDAPIAAEGPAALTGTAFRRIAVADANTPAGKYARQSLERAGLLAALRPRFAGQHDVRAATVAVALGNADAGIVYATDARVEPRVRVLFAIDPATHDEIEYLAAVVKDSKKAAAARELLRFFASPDAARVWERHGFLAPGGR